MLAEGTLPPGYTVKKRALVKVKGKGKKAKKAQKAQKAQKAKRSDKAGALAAVA